METKFKQVNCSDYDGNDKRLKVPYPIAVNGTPSHSYTGCHLPYGITQCYLPPDTSEHTPP